MTVHFNPETVRVEINGLHEKRSEQKEQFKLNIDPDFGKRNIIEPVYDVPVVGGVVRGTGAGVGEEQGKKVEEDGDLEVVDGMDMLLPELPIIGGED